MLNKYGSRLFLGILFFYGLFPEFYYFLLGFSMFRKMATGFLLKADSLFIYTSIYFLHVFCLIFYYSSVFSITGLVDMLVVDYLRKPRTRFEVTYNLLSHYQNIRFFFKLFVALYGLVPSVVFFFPSARWLEREAWDFFGVRFLWHDNLRRILTDYGFKGHPMRKDFPLIGFLETRYDDSFASVIAEPVELAQQQRFSLREDPAWVF